MGSWPMKRKKNLHRIINVFVAVNICILALISVFPLFGGMLVRANEFKTKKNKN